MAEIAVAAKGIAADCLASGYIGLADFHVAERLGIAARETRELPRLALALAMRALRTGSVCVDLMQLNELAPENGASGEPVTWPDPDQLLEELISSPLVTYGLGGQGTAPLRLVGTLLYLERYWQTEKAVEKALASRRGTPALSVDRFPNGAGVNAQQAAAIEAVADHGVSVITGGPGTGKTHTVAGILAAYRGLPLIALAAPTGKAAARLQESVAADLPAGMPVPTGTTIHALLGLVPTRPYQPRYHAANPLPHDLVIIDETSMVSLVIMRQVLEALRPDARLVLLGDRDQLASVEAGAVLADIVDSPDLLAATGVTRLTRNYRFGGAISELSEAIRTGDVDGCLAALKVDDAVRLVDADAARGLSALTGLDTQLLDWASGLQLAALEADAVRATEILDDHRLLCAHRDGIWGVSRWNQLARRWLAGQLQHQYGLEHRWYPGQPLLVSQNNSIIGDEKVWNGDAAVVVRTAEGLRAAIHRGDGPLLVAPQLLSGVGDLFAMTVHKSQGSQFRRVSLILPPADSPLLTRELIYTAVTRAREQVTIYGTKEALLTAVNTPVRRASGLATA